MKKKFEIPEALLVSFTDEDIITTSINGLPEGSDPDEEIIWPKQ